MATASWHLDRDGVEYGPFDWDRLQAMARDGRLRPTDLVRREGVPYWQPAYEARGDLAVSDAVAASGPGPVQVAPARGAEARQRIDAPRRGAAPIVPNDETPSDAHTSSAAAEDVRVPAGTATPPETATPHAPGTAAPERPSPAGSAVLALVLAVGGLFWFGLFLGGLAIVVGRNALSNLRGSSRPAARRVALAALVAGAVEVLVVSCTLIARLYASVRATGH